MLGRRAVLVGAGLALVARPARAAPFYYKEWRFDTSAVPNQLSTALTQSLEAQIDIVEALPLRPDVLRFFRNFDTKVDPATLGKAAFYRTEKARSSRRRMAQDDTSLRRGATVHRIYLSNKPVPPDHPVFLRVLLLAYLDRRVSDADGERVEAWLEEAKRSGAFGNRSEMMHSPEDFFADGAGAVLRGKWPDEPFERAKVRGKLPAFHDWVVHEFVADGAALQ